eukprot:TRINITY_DN21421_c0_g1_i1.p1 TRINITY_DN21421_c0_g1~~TRINITY_DN21421_c0_g1_i1.p1  ORF type:complete len:409 (+),score=69.05 TRINITY_DN21421_c0_g1_i1:56-1282(+)
MEMEMEKMEAEELCSRTAIANESGNESILYSSSSSPPRIATNAELRSLSAEERVERSWKKWREIGEPKFIVAPMVDQSELPFRMLCRRYGATAAYTPMLHARLFSQDEKYRSLEFSTCKEDRPLFVQFCTNDPETLFAAAQIVQPHCDYVDINLGCPQRIAKRGNYGAFLMDNLPLVKSLVEKLANHLAVPVSCKIRIFPNIEDTIAYAKMLEEAGCSLLAIHGRTREQKDGKSVRADWNAIRSVKKALRIPVLANGNIRHLEDAYHCLRETGADGVLSAESLLENPGLFAGYHPKLTGTENKFDQEKDAVERNETTIPVQSEEKILDPPSVLLEYFDLCEKYPVPWRMVRAHVHRVLGNLFRIHPDLREELNRQSKLTFEWLRDLVTRLDELHRKSALQCATKKWLR